MRRVIPVPVRQALRVGACVAVSIATFLLWLAMAGQVLAAEPTPVPLRLTVHVAPGHAQSSAAYPELLRRQLPSMVRVRIAD